MLDMATVYKIQQRYNLHYNTQAEGNEKTLTEYYKALQEYLNHPTTFPPAYKAKETTNAQRAKLMDKAIETFVEEHKYRVEGYINDLGEMDFEALLKDCKNYIHGEGVLAEALLDPEVDEIQVNDLNTIYVVKGGVSVPYLKDGRPVKFNNNSEIETLVNKIVDDGTGNTVLFAEGVPLYNAKTAKQQYRISVTHSIANTRGVAPYDFPVTTITLRKFKEVKLTLDQLVQFNTITKDMADLITLIGRSGIGMCFVGITGSGKTTLMNIVAQLIPMHERIICIQNPTEITFQERDDRGRNHRNVLHWEASDSADSNNPTSNTMANLISHALRNTPDVILIGEARRPEEFDQILRATKTGQVVYMTYHAAGYLGAIPRFVSEVANGRSEKEVTKDIAEHMGIIFAQHRYPDGSRKVTAICEVNGVKANGEPNYNLLYEFVEDAPEEDVNGKVHLRGHFEQRNPISENLIRKFNSAMILPKEYEKFTKVNG